MDHWNRLPLGTYCHAKAGVELGSGVQWEGVAVMLSVADGTRSLFTTAWNGTGATTPSSDDSSTSRRSGADARAPRRLTSMVTVVLVKGASAGSATVSPLGKRRAGSALVMRATPPERVLQPALRTSMVTLPVSKLSSTPSLSQLRTESSSRTLTTWGAAPTE